MALQIGTFQGLEARIARVSFTGDLSYEISVPNKNAKPLWRAVCAIGAPLGVVPIGVEALSILRAEKGYIIIGKDTDGETMPHDLGFSVPRNKKKVPYVGDRSLHTEYANSDTRLQLVGLAVEEGQPALPTGAHLIEYSASKPKSIGYVTSSYVSPILNRPIALGLVQAGQSRAGETVQVWHLGKQLKAIINTPGFYDQEGVILNA